MNQLLMNIYQLHIWYILMLQVMNKFLLDMIDMLMKKLLPLLLNKYRQNKMNKMTFQLMIDMFQLDIFYNLLNLMMNNNLRHNLYK